MMVDERLCIGDVIELDAMNAITRLGDEDGTVRVQIGKLVLVLQPDGGKPPDKLPVGFAAPARGKGGPSLAGGGTLAATDGSPSRSSDRAQYRGPSAGRELRHHRNPGGTPLFRPTLRR
jgi:hypothetical protein